MTRNTEWTMNHWLLLQLVKDTPTPKLCIKRIHTFHSKYIIFIHFIHWKHIIPVLIISMKCQDSPFFCLQKSWVKLMRRKSSCITITSLIECHNQILHYALYLCFSNISNNRFWLPSFPLQTSTSTHSTPFPWKFKCCSKQIPEKQWVVGGEKYFQGLVTNPGLGLEGSGLCLVFFKTLVALSAGSPLMGEGIRSLQGRTDRGAC